MAPKSLKYLLPAAQSSSNTESGCICAPFSADALDAALLGQAMAVLRKLLFISWIFFLHQKPSLCLYTSNSGSYSCSACTFLACVGSSSRAHFVNSCDRCIIVQGQVTLQACGRQFTGPMLAVLECIHRTWLLTCISSCIIDYRSEKGRNLSHANHPLGHWHTLETQKTFCHVQHRLRTICTTLHADAQNNGIPSSEAQFS